MEVSGLTHVTLVQRDPILTDRRLGRPQSRSGRRREEKLPWLCRELNHSQHVSRDFLTMLSRRIGCLRSPVNRICFTHEMPTILCNHKCRVATRMETARSSETSISYYIIPWCHNAADNSLNL